MLDRDFSRYDLDEAIKKLARNKAPGPDTIPNELWKSLEPHHREKLLICINHQWNEERLPENSSEIIIRPIYKKEDPMLPKNYRPISLVNTCLKLFTIMLSNRLNVWCRQNNIISDYQAAYKTGAGCPDHVFTLQSALQCNLKTKKSVVFACFIDLSSAFDSIKATCYGKSYRK